MFIFSQRNRKCKGAGCVYTERTVELSHQQQVQRHLNPSSIIAQGEASFLFLDHTVFKDLAKMILTGKVKYPFIFQTCSKS